MGTWAERLESEPVAEKPQSRWAAKLDEPEKVEEEDQIGTGELVLKSVLSAPETVENLVDYVAENYGEISSDIARGTAAGLYKSGGDLMTLGSMGVEAIYDAGRVVGREAYKLATDTPEAEMGPFELTDYLSRNFRETTERDVKAIVGDQGTIGKYAQHIAEYAGITQAVTRNMLAKGKALNELPTVISNNKVVGFFQKSMMVAAKNPTAAIKMEQGVSALVASSGELAKQLGVEEGGQFVTEVVTGLASGQILNTTKSILNFVSKKFPGSAGRIGKIQAAEYLQTVFKNDPAIYKKLDRGLQLQKETGIRMSLDELTNNQELKAALQLMEFRTSGSVTAFETKLAGQTKAIKDMFKSAPELKESAIKGIDDMQSDIEIALDRQATKAVDNVLDQIDNAAPLDREALGESGRAALDSSREAMESEVNRLYKEVGNPNIKTNVLVKAVQEAKKSSLVDDAYMKELDADLVDTLEKNVLGRMAGGEKVLDAPVKKIYLGRGEKRKIPEEMSLDAMRTIESRLKERIRIANAAGKANEARILTKILGGVFDQYKTVTGAEANQIANLKKAASASKRLHEIFDQGEVLLQSRIDVKGMERITTEGFVRNFVKPNSDTKFARTNEAVDGFYNAYGDMPEAKQWLSNAFGSLLKEEIMKMGEKVNPRQIKKFIDRHSRFLKRARIEGKFDTVVKSVQEANLADTKLVLTKKEFQRTLMSKFIGADDPVNFVMNKAKSGGLRKLQAEIKKIPNAARRETVDRGVKEALWEGIKREATTSKVASGQEIILDTGSIRKLLDHINYGQQLKDGLGKDHYRNLIKFIDIIDRISPTVSSTAGLPKAHIDEKLVEKLMTGLRAAAHGFVRPDLIAAQMSMRGYKAITTKQAHRVLKEAMENPDFAKELLKMSTSVRGKEILGTMFSPLVAPVISDKEKKDKD